MAAHINLELPEYLLDLLQDEDNRRVEAHLQQCDQCLQELANCADSLAVFAASIAPIAPSPELRDRLVNAVRSPRYRFAPFAARLAELVDGDPHATEEALARTAEPTAWQRAPWPDVELLPLEAVCKASETDIELVRVACGKAFPQHVNLTEETVLVLQGSLEERDGTTLEQGQLAHLPVGRKHGFASVGSSDLITAVMVRGAMFPQHGEGL